MEDLTWLDSRKSIVHCLLEVSDLSLELPLILSWLECKAIQLYLLNKEEITKTSLMLSAESLRMKESSAAGRVAHPLLLELWLLILACWSPTMSQKKDLRSTWVKREPTLSGFFHHWSVEVSLQPWVCPSITWRPRCKRWLDFQMAHSHTAVCLTVLIRQRETRAFSGSGPAFQLTFSESLLMLWL